MNICDFKKAQQVSADLQQVEADFKLLKQSMVYAVELNMTKAEEEYGRHSMYGRRHGMALKDKRLATFIYGCAKEWYETRIKQLEEELFSLGVDASC